MAKSAWKEFRRALDNSLLFVGLLVLVFLADSLLGGRLAAFGILPRTASGLAGIVFSPLLHGSAAHLAANAVPLLVLLVLLFWDRRYQPGATLGIIWVASGLGTWLIGRSSAGGQPAIHIGASSLVYGLAAYLLAAAFWQRRWRAAFVAVLVFLLYGGLWQGALPQAGPVSWEGHLSGMVAGVWCARRLHG